MYQYAIIVICDDIKININLNHESPGCTNQGIALICFAQHALTTARERPFPAMMNASPFNKQRSMLFKHFSKNVTDYEFCMMSSQLADLPRKM